MAITKVSSGLLESIITSSSDPTISSNPSGGVGTMWINSTSGEAYVCTDATSGANVWTNIGAGTGNIEEYSAEYVTVAGGGAGGYGAFGDAGGGAGGGGYRSSVSGENSGRGTSAESTLNLITGTVYTITVGAGGSGGFPSTVGENSSISGSNITTVTSNGGGAGGDRQGSNTKDGGCGGGGGWLNTTAGSGTAGQGYDGGVMTATWVPGAAGGGSGGAASGSSNEVEGVGTSTSITGSSVTYAAGGHGGSSTNGTNPIAGSVNTGDGGGGYYGSSGNGANGGSGVVILRVPTVNYSGTTTGSPTVTTSGSNTIIKFTSSGSYTG